MLMAGTNITLDKSTTGATRTVTINAAGGPGGGSTPTNLGYTAAPAQGTVTSSSGADATLPVADATNAGLMTPTQRQKLDDIEVNATADQTASEIKVKLEELRGTARLANSAVQPLDIVPENEAEAGTATTIRACLLYTSPSPRD